jgi:AraC-like DNA-binding protein
MKKQRQLQNRANTNARIDVGINVGTPWRRMFGMIAGAALLSGCYAAGSAPQPSAADTANIPSAIATATAASSTLQWQPHVVTGFAAPGVEVTGDVNLTIAASPYRLVSSNQGLQVFRAGVLVAQFAGEFSRLKAQMLVPALAGDDMVVMAIEQQQNKIWLWRFNSSTAAAPFSADKAQQWPVQSRVLDDICLYQSPTHAQLSLFLIGDRGGADQWLLWQQQWLTSPLSIRQLNIPYNTKACAVDADAGHLYVAEAERAIWRYNAEAEADESRQLWQVQQPFGALAGEISSLAILPDQTVLALQEEPAQLLHFSSLGQLQLQSALDGQHLLPTQPTKGTLEFIPVLPMAQCQHFFIVTLCSFLLTLIKQQLHQTSAITLELQHAARKPNVHHDLSSVLSWQLGAEVMYPAQRDCLRIPLSLWTAPFQHACAAKFSVAKRNCRQMNRILLRRRSLIEQIYRLQKRQLPDVLQLNTAAEHLHLPAVQLQRWLKTQHSSLSKITDQVRHDLTRKCLTQPDFSNRRMADRLGYSDEHNFRRAFKRWTGALPSMLRR